jgi:trimeric autotransporter adhesin
MDSGLTDVAAMRAALDSELARADVLAAAARSAEAAVAILRQQLADEMQRGAEAVALAAAEADELRRQLVAQRGSKAHAEVRARAEANAARAIAASTRAASFAAAETLALDVRVCLAAVAVLIRDVVSEQNMVPLSSSGLMGMSLPTRQVPSGTHASSPNPAAETKPENVHESAGSLSTMTNGPQSVFFVAGNGDDAVPIASHPRGSELRWVHDSTTIPSAASQVLDLPHKNKPTGAAGVATTATGFDLGALLRDVESAGPMESAQAVLEERTVLRVRLSTVTGQLRESERERTLLHEQLATLKGLLRAQEAVGLAEGGANAAYVDAGPPAPLKDAMDSRAQTAAQPDIYMSASVASVAQHAAKVSTDATGSAVQAAKNLAAASSAVVAEQTGILSTGMDSSAMLEVLDAELARADVLAAAARAAEAAVAALRQQLADERLRGAAAAALAEAEADELRRQLAARRGSREHGESRARTALDAALVAVDAARADAGAARADANAARATLENARAEGMRLAAELLQTIVECKTSVDTAVAFGYAQEAAVSPTAAAAATMSESGPVDEGIGQAHNVAAPLGDERSDRSMPPSPGVSAASASAKGQVPASASESAAQSPPTTPTTAASAVVAAAASNPPAQRSHPLRPGPRHSWGGAVDPATPPPAPAARFSLGILLRDLPRPLPLLDLDRAMSDERAGHRVRLEALAERLRESERERELVHLQLAHLKELLAMQAAAARRAGRADPADPATSAAAGPAGAELSDAERAVAATARLEYAKAVVVRFLETRDVTLLPALREVPEGHECWECVLAFECVCCYLCV